VRKGYVNEHGCFNFMRVTYRVRKSKTIKMGHSGHTARVPSRTAQIELTVRLGANWFQRHLVADKAV
jgi:sialic acid synthase SpsE